MVISGVFHCNIIFYPQLHSILKKQVMNSERLHILFKWMNSSSIKNVGIPLSKCSPT